jgi:uncharacterized protein
MSEYSSAPHSQQTFLRHHSVTSYFVLTFAISWTGAFVVIAPALLHGEQLPKLARLLVFPVLLLGPCVAGLVLTWIVGGCRQFRNLFSKMCDGRVPVWWYAVLLIPPVLILLTLKCFQIAVSPVFVPTFFIHGAVFGLFAGYLEEIGWTGFAFPMMLQRQGALWSALVLGLLWAIWHLPAVDQLGTATPRTSYRRQYFLVFAITMVSIRESGVAQSTGSWSFRNVRTSFPSAGRS